MCSSPLPATLAGRLTARFQRGFGIRVVTRGISSGFVAAFRHRRSPPDLLLPGPRNLPFGRSLGCLRVFPWSHAAPCGATQAFEVSLAFSLDPAPYGFRFGVRAIPAVMNPRFLPGASPRVSIRQARRHFCPDLSVRVVRLPPLRDSSCASHVPTVCPLGSCQRLFYVRRSPAGSSRFLPVSRPATSNRLFGTYCLRRVLPLNLRDLSEPS